jgi:phosphoribosylglycinamide formyltransferase-1
MFFVVLSSSRGSVLQATIDAMKRGELHAICAGLVTDKPDRECIEKAKAVDLPYRIVERSEGESREEYDEKVDAAVRDLFYQKNAEWKKSECCLAAMGWMFILTPWFIKQWKGRILNVHPALLPKYGGKGMYGHNVHKAVLAAKEKTSGMTIHLMDDGVDTGKILLQKECPVLPDDELETLCGRAGRLEREWYPKVLEMIEKGEIKL